jgi:hypothetical protein
MQLPHPTFCLHNGFFRIALALVEIVYTLEQPGTDKHLTAAL